MKVIFMQAAFKNIQGLLGKIHGFFKDIPQTSNLQGLFKDMMLFKGLFKGPCEPCPTISSTHYYWCTAQIIIITLIIRDGMG